MRYIITRPCLSQGQLQILKYLQPYFPAEGQVTFQDSRGDSFVATVEAARHRLTGLGELYHAHHLGVNDVLLLTPRPDGVYGVECVVKPHARPAAATLPAPTPPAIQKRVVIHATPHVREVRMERVNAPETSSAPQQASSSTSQQAAAAAQPAQPQASTQGPAASQPTASQPRPAGKSPEAQAAIPRPSQTGKTPEPSASVPASETAPASKSLPPLTALPQGTRPAVALSETTPPTAARTGIADAPAARAIPGGPVTESRPAAFAAALDSTPLPQPAPKAATTVAVAVLPAPAAQQTARSVAATPAPARPTEGQTTEQQLVQLAKLTGYTFEHLGGNVVRLRASLGAQSYSVLLAMTPEGLNSPLWKENADYRALLTAEDERPQGIARFTQAALTSLLEHAQLAPLTPVDLRGYWNTGSFDYRSVESVAELVSAHLAQRGIFSHVLMTLAQQPAHSLVQVTRLAERLGSGVNTAELQSILETLSRPPFMALTPLPDGQFYLRGEVRDLLGEVGDYTEGMRRRLK